MKDIVIAIIGSGALSAVVSAIITQVNSTKSIGKAVQLLMLGEIKRQGREYLEQGSLSLEELQAFNECYTAYKKLGGNGYAETIHVKVNALPLGEQI